MLDATVGIKQPRADRANAGLQRLADHLFEPIGRYDGEIVVQERDKFGIAFADCEIVEPAIIEISSRAEDAHARVVLHPLEISERFGIARPVVDQKDLEIRIGRAREELSTHGWSRSSKSRVGMMMETLGGSAGKR